MAQADTSNTQPDTDGPTRELPEAFTNPVATPDEHMTEIYNDDPTAEDEETSTGLDRVNEGSQDSFPGSDPPAVTPTKVADRPTQP